MVDSYTYLRFYVFGKVNSTAMATMLDAQDIPHQPEANINLQLPVVESMQQMRAA